MNAARTLAAAILFACGGVLLAAGCGRRVLLGADAPASMCKGKVCGEPCLIVTCPPDAKPECTIADVKGQCDGAGTCQAVPKPCAVLVLPCDGKTCGDSCDACTPGSPGCGADEMKPPPPGTAFSCDASGTCTPGQATCPCDACEPNIVPCKGIPCGQPCKACALMGSADCSFSDGTCDANGACIVGGVACPPPPFSPCSAKLCGDACTPCDPMIPGCVAPTDPMACDTSGMCIAAGNVMCPQPPYQPCVMKACGEACSPCDPTIPGCVLPSDPMACDSSGACVGPMPPTCM